MYIHKIVYVYATPTGNRCVRGLITGLFHSNFYWALVKDFISHFSFRLIRTSIMKKVLNLTCYSNWNPFLKYPLWYLWQEYNEHTTNFSGIWNRNEWSVSSSRAFNSWKASSHAVVRDHVRPGGLKKVKRRTRVYQCRESNPCSSISDQLGNKLC
jgi:hypothetical protein